MTLPLQTHAATCRDTQPDLSARAPQCPQMDVTLTRPAVEEPAEDLTNRQAERGEEAFHRTAPAAVEAAAGFAWFA